MELPRAVYFAGVQYPNEWIAYTTLGRGLVLSHGPDKAAVVYEANSTGLPYEILFTKITPDA